MTKEEYRAQTEIANAEEAAEYLWNLRAMFIAVFAARYGVYFLGSFGFTSQMIQVYAFCLGGLCLFFIYYCLKIIRLTKNVTKANAIWSILFAPLSWFWFYPEITKPLKIITGEIEPPASIQPIEERRQIEQASWKRYWKTLIIVFLISLVVACIPILMLLFQDRFGT